MSYPRIYDNNYQYGGKPGVIVKARNVDIVAGLGGAGDGIYINGAWLGSSVTASGQDPVTGAPSVSTITTTNGCGVNFSAAPYAASPAANGPHTVLLSNVVFYGCSSDGIRLATTAMLNQPWIDPVQATLVNCTIADNGGAGLGVTIGGTGSWVSVTNCIFSGNVGNDVSLSSTNNAFTCMEDYNVFYSNSSGTNLLVNGAVQSPDASSHTSTNNPLFCGNTTKPDPWYKLSSRSSPAYHSGNNGSYRGAYQVEVIASGMMLIVK